MFHLNSEISTTSGIYIKNIKTQRKNVLSLVEDIFKSMLL